MAVIVKRSTSWFLIILGLVAVAIVFLPAQKADALGQYEFEAWYFSDNTYTEQVGYRYMSCEGYNEHWGDTTAYAAVISERRCSAPPNNPGAEAWVYYCQFDAPSGTQICYVQSGP